MRKQPSPATATTSRCGELGRDGGGEAEAHGAAGGGELGGELAVGIEAVQPGGIVAGAVADDGVGRPGPGQVGEDLGAVEPACDGDRLGEGAGLGG